MGPIRLKIEQLVLDTDNPRITHAEGQHQALQKVVRDQRTKLVRLGQSIVERGLSPIDRMMVMQVNPNPKRYIALEGNRRVATLRLLAYPALMTGLEMPTGTQRPLEQLARVFNKSSVEPIDCHEVGAREDGRYWIELRHNGEDSGRGVVDWKPIVAARFRKRGPEIQAFDMVVEHGGFTEEEAERIRTGFSLTTLARLMNSPDVLNLTGLTLKDGRLHTTLLAAELIKPLRKMVTDIADKTVDSRTFNRTEGMISYVQGFSRGDKADLSKSEAERPIEGIQTAEFTRARSAATRAARRSDPAARTTVVPRNCPVNVTDNRISEIYSELRKLRLTESRNAIAVLLRVFLEMSVDHFLEANGGSVRFTPPGSTREVYKKLDKKLADTVDMLVSLGVPRNHFAAAIRSLSVQTSPMHLDLFHMYVHERFATPSPQELTAAWNNAQPLFEKIWP